MAKMTQISEGGGGYMFSAIFGEYVSDFKWFTFLERARLTPLVRHLPRAFLLVVCTFHNWEERLFPMKNRMSGSRRGAESKGTANPEKVYPI